MTTNWMVLKPEIQQIVKIDFDSIDQEWNGMLYLNKNGKRVDAVSCGKVLKQIIKNREFAWAYNEKLVNEILADEKIEDIDRFKINQTC